MESEKNISGTRNGNFYLEYQPSINYAMVRNGVKTVIACSLENADEEDWHNVKVVLVGEQMVRQEVVIDVVEAGKSTLLESLRITAAEESLANLTADVETVFTIMITIEGEEVFRQNYLITLRPDDYYLHLDENEHQKEITKQTIWERKLLDFSLRNNMINCKLGKRVIPFVSFDINKLEDMLQEGKDYSVIPYPEKLIEPEKDGMYHSATQAAPLREKVLTGIEKNHQITSYLSETDLRNALKFIYRTSRNALEENGANTLFVVLGMLKWYENEKSTIARYAPLLMLPVDIVRKAGQNYVIRLRDEDVIMNITLLELLKQQFRINMSVLNPLPTDEHGVDVTKILNTVRMAVREQKNWMVMDEASLGLFYFNKFVMWNDIHSNAEKLKENEVVKSLMEGRVALKDFGEVVDARDVDKKNQPLDFCIPIDVDSSQMEAVIESGRGKSFILYGPPGTGKSQTITNMIANALYQDKRVLFVAEKMAALEVVQKRLAKIGLDPFCLELHSNKVTKSHFLNQMQKALDVVHVKEPEAYKATSDKLYAHRQQMITYIENLHRKQQSGFSLYECITRHLSVEGTEMKGNLPKPADVNKEKLSQWVEKIESLNTVFKVTGHPSSHPLLGLFPHAFSNENKEKLLTLLAKYQNEYAKTEQAIADAPVKLELAPNDLNWATTAYGLLEQLPKQTLQQFIQQDADMWQERWQTISNKWFLPKFFGKRSFKKEFSQFSGISDFAAAPELLEKQKKFKQLLKDYCLSHHADYNTSETALCDTLAADRLAAISKQEKVLNETVKEIEGIAVLEQYNTLPAARLSKLNEQISTWLNHFDSFKDWCLWSERRKDLVANGLQTVVTAIEKDGMLPDEASDAFQKGMYHLLTMDIVDKDPSLAKFNGLIFEEMVDKYKQETYTFQNLSKQELYCHLAAQIPSQTIAATANSEMGILKRNIANGGRGTSIRKIIDQIPTLMPKLCPCMLMSPISVAQYIDMNADKFDLVIFDEASQMPTSEAVGAIARGKALICVGDPKQMPPTSFFSTQTVDEEEVEIDDMESILDDCITLSMPGHYLSWHYRSKHESLIAFSNLKYYDGKLHTFPSIDDQQSKVRLVQLDGEYDKGKTRSNPAEAKAIVDEVLHRLADPEMSKLSIGVVSFSKVQQNLIEDMLIDALAKHPDLEAKAYNCEEPIFIKNLENVQGDERDVILFSVGYGPDKQGHVSMNFGPLNNEGGERRLNVAVSRARYEMIVYAILHAEQIDLNRSNAKGVEGLKSFIEFAGKGTVLRQSAADNNILGGNEDAESDLVKLVASELSAKGYKTVTHVGRSQFKIDIAVVNPEKDDEYMMGILCDGRNYYETKTTRDREIVQPGVLAGLKWNVMRVWAVDWYANHDQVMARILQRLEDVKNNVKHQNKEVDEAKSLASKAFDASGLKTEKEKEYHLPERWENMSITEIPSEEVQKVVMLAVEQNLSIPQEELKRLVVKLLGFNRRTNKTDMVVDKAVELLKTMNKITVSSDGMIAMK
ncbi:MAG: DUF4011 domain-containing protein [Prevotella sp.]|nr:DUF4011 domain-containing protein [Prevotella sp.]